MFRLLDRSWINIDLESFAKRRGYNRFLSALKYCVKVFHNDEFRADERSYDTHPKKVCQILIYFGIDDEDTLIAALFHDAPESVGIGLLEMILEDYGQSITLAVSLVTKLEEKSFGEYCKKILEDVRAVLIKLSDRIHNLRNMVKLIGEGSFFTKSRLESQVKETRKYIIPMANKAIIIFPESAEIIRKMKKEIEYAIKIAELIVT
jgi:(p)ppGpp synthase/HD superfamily hydrolase